MATADGSIRVPGSILSPRLFDTPLDFLKWYLTIFAVNANYFYEIDSCFYDILKDAQATDAMFALEGSKNEKKH